MSFALINISVFLNIGMLEPEIPKFIGWLLSILVSKIAPPIFWAPENLLFWSNDMFFGFKSFDKKIKLTKLLSSSHFKVSR